MSSRQTVVQCQSWYKAFVTMPQSSNPSGYYALFVHFCTSRLTIPLYLYTMPNPPSLYIKPYERLSSPCRLASQRYSHTTFAHVCYLHDLHSIRTSSNGTVSPPRTPKMRFQDSYSKLALALAFLPFGLSHPLGARDVSLTPAQVLTVAPTAGSCEGAPTAGQCRTAEQATPMILNSFRAYGITSPNEMAAILSTIAFESGDFKYDRPTNGEPGKGTRNMQSAAFNMKFALSIPGLGEKLSSVNPNGILELLTSNDAYSYGSAAWYATTQCGPTVRSGLAGGSLAGWQTYVTGCLHATPSTDRQAYWQRAVKALGAA